MRMSIIVPLVIAAALLGETQVSNAQSPYSYPWCALGGTRDSNALSCYYTSWEQCRTTMSGIGGLCVASPYYHAQPTQLPHRSLLKPRPHRHTRTVGVREQGEGDRAFTGLRPGAWDAAARSAHHRLRSPSGSFGDQPHVP